MSLSSTYKKTYITLTLLKDVANRNAGVAHVCLYYYLLRSSAQDKTIIVISYTLEVILHSLH